MRVCHAMRGLSDNFLLDKLAGATPMAVQRANSERATQKASPERYRAFMLFRIKLLNPNGNRNFYTVFIKHADPVQSKPV